MSYTAEIEALTARWADAYAAVRIEEATDCFAPDGLYMVPGKPPAIGRDALLELHRFWLRNGGPEFSTEHVGSGMRSPGTASIPPPSRAAPSSSPAS